MTEFKQNVLLKEHFDVLGNDVCSVSWSQMKGSVTVRLFGLLGVSCHSRNCITQPLQKDLWSIAHIPRVVLLPLEPIKKNLSASVVPLPLK